jgi:hypothetical protein
MLFFPTLKTTATSYEQAEELWTRSKDVFAVPGQAEGQLWKVNLLKKDSKEAPANYQEWYAQKIWEAEVLYAVMAAPVAFTSPAR